MNNLDYDLKELIKQEHHRAELERLRAGFDGCGCSECQEFYKTIDLTPYGDRVKQVVDIITISAGKAGADLWQQYHPTEKPPEGIDSPLDKENDVSKIPDKEIISVNKNNGIMKQRGRPRKTGKVSRVTAWRRDKEREVQGVLV